MDIIHPVREIENDMSFRGLSIALLLVGVLHAGAQQYVTNTYTPVADTYVRNQPGTENNNYGTLDYIYLYTYSEARDYYGYVRFDISDLPAGTPIIYASLTFTKVGNAERNDGLTTSRFRVLGLLDVVGNTPQDWGETWLTWNNKGSEYVSENTYATDRVVDFDGTAGEEYVSGTEVGSIARISGVNLVNFLNSRLSSDSYRGLVTFIVDMPTAEGGRGYGLASKENLDEAARPTLLIAYVPEPSVVVLGLGVGLVALAMARRQR